MSDSGATGFLIFLDRDGTIIEDRDYLSDPDGVSLLPGAVEGLLRFSALGGLLVVVTNQSGIGRGYFDRRAADAVNDRVQELLASVGIRLAGIYLCPHHPEDGCECRKPGTLMFETASREHGLPLDDSYMIGDRMSDVEAGRRIGARTFLITGEPQAPDDCGADYVVCDLTEVADLIESSRSSEAT